MKKWPSELRHPLFLAGTAVYLVAVMYKHGGSLSVHWPLPTVMRSYVADMLALPLELTMLLWFFRRFYFHRPSFVLPTSWIFSTWVVMSVWFEAILPHFDARATPDPLDVVAYAAGGVVFWRWLNHPAVA